MDEPAALGKPQVGRNERDGKERDLKRSLEQNVQENGRQRSRERERERPRGVDPPVVEMTELNRSRWLGRPRAEG
eukprot:jgi/Chlat1/3824/Chrsp26S04047